METDECGRNDRVDLEVTLTESKLQNCAIGPLLIKSTVVIEGNASLAALYGTEQNKASQNLAALYAPIIRLDENEPFRPLAAGYTIFHQDTDSPSFNRTIRLKSRKLKADQVIEYAIWWDWDINHLYDLEHIWVYLDQDGRPVKVEGSWHGEVIDLATNGRLPLKETHPFVYAAPGKHAFAPDITHFQQRHAKVPELIARFVGAMGIVQNGLFKGHFHRSPPVDRLIHTYLHRSVFEPSWNYSRDFTFTEEMLVPWPALRQWIPRRVKGLIQFLQQEITPEDYRTLRILRCTSIEDINQAAGLDVDMVTLDIGRNRWGFPALSAAPGRPTGANIVRLLQACQKVRLGAYLVIQDGRTIPWLARLLGREDWSDYLMTGASNPEWIIKIKAKVPQYRTVLIMETPPPDVVAAAQSTGASYIHVTSPSNSWLTPSWVNNIRQAELGIVISAAGSSELPWVRSLGVEALVLDDPALFEYPPSTNP